MIQRHPVNRPKEVVSDLNFIRDVHNHIILSNNRASNVKDGEDAVDLSFSPTLIVPLKVDESNVYKTRTLLDSGSGTNWICKKLLPFIKHIRLGNQKLNVLTFNGVRKGKFDLVEVYFDNDGREQALACFVIDDFTQLA